MKGVDVASLLTIFAFATLAAMLSALVGRWFVLPIVVLEILFGILIGPQVLSLATIDPTIELLATGGLGMLFFFAGYEIDFQAIKGSPLKLGAIAWLVSLVIAYTSGALLAWAGVIVSGLYTGTAMATTALGTLLPILNDAGETKSRFGNLILAAGAVGEFGPILLTTILFSTTSATDQAGILGLFVIIAVAAALIATRSTRASWPILERSLKSSGQGAVRVVVLLIIALVGLAHELGLELLLGGFVAGIITRMSLKGREVEEFESKIVAIGYGFFIPFFFVVSGIRFDLDSLISSSSGLLKLPLFYVLMIVVRGAPALFFYRGQLPELKDRFAFGLFTATQLPLVVAITTIATETNHMRSSTASALVGAAILTTATFPLAALALRKPEPITA